MEDIQLDLADYKTILAHKGKIIGVVDSSNINELVNSLDETIKENLKKAKGVLINFGIHKDQSLFAINDLMSEIHDLINDETEIIFTTEQNSSDDKDNITYQMIITGL